ncbi:MAG: hypothetical protein L6R28_08075 [Planctomycetes bacterium]|nr:hypothetical protein [Planctomycetota bacterium]
MTTKQTLRNLLGIILALALSGSVHAEETALLKPAGGDGGGEVVGGLQASAKAVKKEFGPGESILVQWTLTNVGDAAAELRFLRGSDSYKYLYLHLEVTKDGKAMAIRYSRDKARLNADTVTKTLAPGAKHEEWIDLNSGDWTPLKEKGKYDVVLVYANGRTTVKTGKVSFAIAVPGLVTGIEIKPEEEKAILALIKDLGHDEFTKRQEAEKQLLAFGDKAVNLLHDASENGEDLEVRTRAKRIIDAIRDAKNQRRVQKHLCAPCTHLAFTADVGTCQRCNGHTPSGGWRYCGTCAVALGQCAACGKALNAAPPPPVIIRPVPRPRPEPPPAPAPEPQPVVPPAPPIEDDF